MPPAPPLKSLPVVPLTSMLVFSFVSPPAEGIASLYHKERTDKVDEEVVALPPTPEQAMRHVPRPIT